MPRQLEQTPRCCCNKAFGGFSTGQKTLGESAEGGEGKALTELRLQPTF